MCRPIHVYVLCAITYKPLLNKPPKIIVGIKLLNL